jgi:hypothetical protein
LTKFFFFFFFFFFFLRRVPFDEEMTVEQLYEQAKAGLFDKLIVAFDDDYALAGTTARFVKPSSGWTVLHQAAFWGSRTGARHAIAFGADVRHRSTEGQTAADVARSKGFNELAQWIDAADPGASQLWTVSNDTLMRPSSGAFDGKLTPVQADRDFNVAYAGGVVNVEKGRTLYVDTYGRVVVGWHGTYSPPCDMDGNSCVRDEE